MCRNELVTNLAYSNKVNLTLRNSRCLLLTRMIRSWKCVIVIAFSITTFKRLLSDDSLEELLSKKVRALRYIFALQEDENRP